MLDGKPQGETTAAQAADHGGRKSLAQMEIDEIADLMERLAALFEQQGFPDLSAELSGMDDEYLEAGLKMLMLRVSRETVKERLQARKRRLLSEYGRRLDLVAMALECIQLGYSAAKVGERCQAFSPQPGLWMVWSSEYELGIEDVDRQHKGLCELANDLFAACQQGRASRPAAEVISDLTKFADVHFADEEQLMQSLGYPDYEAHRALHEGFKEKLKELPGAPDSPMGQVSRQLLRFLKDDWVREHLMGEDRKFASFVKARLDG